MPHKKPDKRIPFLEPTFGDILVCNDNRWKPNIEIFVQSPENVIQGNLGTIFGIFEVNDDQKNSSYIANYLISVIKKEYFSRPKRGSIESFESALHKANLALSVLAEHGDVNWIGKLNGLIAVIEKNNIHLSQAGTASAFLFRKNFLTDISEGLSSEESAPNPLKTFTNISSGRIEDLDRIFITTEGTFTVFSHEEIKKNFQRFSYDALMQFLKTALGNELEKNASILIEIRAKEKIEFSAPEKSAEPVNAFSQNSFIKNKNQPEVSSELKEEIAKSKEEFTSKKTGHIYIKGNELPLTEENFLQVYFSEMKNSFLLNLKKNIKRAKAYILSTFSMDFLKKNNPPKKSEAQILETKQTPLLNTKAITSFFSELFIKIKKINLKEILSRVKIPNFLPSFSRFKKIASTLDYTQKIYALLVVLLIFFSPILFKKVGIFWQNQKDKSNPATEEATIPLEQDASVLRLGTGENIYQKEGLMGIVFLDKNPYFISRDSIYDFAQKEEIKLPDNVGEIITFSPMEDLRLIFIINQEFKTFAFSPTTKKFQENSLSVPENLEIVSSRSYLTYLYLLDKKNNQIYRYPRAEGGFGEKIDWIKDASNLESAMDIAINKDIYIAKNDGVLKYFRGKVQEFSLESSATPIIPYKIYVRLDSENIYVFDKENARIIKFDGSGKIIRQFYSEEIRKAENFSVDEEKNIIYITNSESALAIKIE
ncbi:MAG: hypothetical protein COU40_00715 [Candidatus Moranbacteria bacterium CG10_big_fil_rev_8_21_14_0_10_35_21]|nr:MAG: hypothetical protein COU40_00715 [Candidatus Moranbacteria bacterium CG10_big_fil_rev_8_21_14_0_10_35_21]